jgi:hypothetical protein
MAYRRFILVIAFATALLLVGGLFTILSAQAGYSFSPNQDPADNIDIPLPDLSVTRVDVFTVTETSVDYRFVIKNEGLTTISMENIYYGTVASNDITYGNSGDVPTGGWAMSTYLAELGPGEAYTLTQTANPDGIYFFDYNYFMVMIDLSDSLIEADEGNNVGYAALPDGPDLIVEDIDVLSINDSGVVYRFVVRNIGDGIADLDGADPLIVTDNVMFQGYLSPNDNLEDPGVIPSSSGFLLDPIELYPGEAFTRTESAGMLGANFLDYRYAFVTIDLTDNLTETLETNNTGMAEVPYFTYLPLTQR